MGSFLLDLARGGLAMPLAVDLSAHGMGVAERMQGDGGLMAEVMVATARRFGAPLAVAPMDLRVEKGALGWWLGLEEEDFHLEGPLEKGVFEELCGRAEEEVSPRMGVLLEALGRVREEARDLIPVGMGIGPFSLLTKVHRDPIGSVFLLGQGMEEEEDEGVGLAVQLLELGRRLVAAYARRQVEAGARAVIVCEPAANTVYLSPRQLEEEEELFERCVMGPCRAVSEAIRGAGGELIFHDCGELTEGMIREFGKLGAAMLSFGASVDLAEAAALVDKETVLYGNVASKHFPSEAEMPLERVREACADLRARMEGTGHPFILGSECDVLSVPGKEEAIGAKAACIAEFSQWGKG